MEAPEDPPNVRKGHPVAPGAHGLVVEVLALVKDDAAEELRPGQGEGVVGDHDVAPLRLASGGLSRADGPVRLSRAAAAAPLDVAQQHTERRPVGAGAHEADGGATREAVEVSLAVPQSEEGERGPREPGLGVVTLLGSVDSEGSPAEGVLAALQDRDLEPAREPRAGERGQSPGDLALHGLTLEGARVRGDADAHPVATRPDEGGQQVGEGLARPRGGMHEQQLVRAEAARDLLGHAVLALAVHLRPRPARLPLVEEVRQVGLEELVEQDEVLVHEGGRVLGVGVEGLVVVVQLGLPGHRRIQDRERVILIEVLGGAL